MALTLTATPGGSDSNAYVTVADAIEYAGYRVGGAAFTGLTDDQKIQALVTAASDIDTLEEDPGFVGDRYAADQTLAWPRDVAELPANLVKANIELAISYATAFARGTDVLNRQLGNGNIKRDKTGPLETEYFAVGPTSATAIERFPPVVQRLLAGLVLQPSDNAWGSAEVVRGS